MPSCLIYRNTCRQYQAWARKVVKKSRDGLTVDRSFQQVEPDKPVRLLWTGGWDSTFRLLTLISEMGAAVQPYYIISPERPSSSIELNTMRAIEGICRADPVRFPGRLLPTILIDRDTIELDPGITEQFKKFRKIARVGGQLEWLARFAKQSGIDGFEFCIDSSTSGTRTTLLKQVVPVKRFPTSTHVLKRDHGSDLAIFQYFEFPLINVSKKQMETLAREHGFLDVMEMTWFCHRPLNENWPCGTCNPCRMAIERGLARRVGWRGRARHRATRMGEGIWPWITRAKALVPLKFKRALRVYLYGRDGN